jgi:hypothetical protein
VTMAIFFSTWSRVGRSYLRSSLLSINPLRLAEGDGVHLLRLVRTARSNR